MGTKSLTQKFKMSESQTNQAFINEDFLLESKSAKILYHDYAKDFPIIDYHNHLSPKAICEDKIYDSITSLWLEGDHYKWRALRTLGTSEKYITGNASQKEKFLKYCSTIPQMIRNPLYHWSHLELYRYFDISDLISAKNAEEIFHQTNKKANSPEFSCLSLLKKMKVEQVCTTDEPQDNLKYHIEYSKTDHYTKMSPTFRPDKFIHIQNVNYNKYLNDLETSAMIKIRSFEHLCEALEIRINYFHAHGCRLSDHGLEFIPYKKTSLSEIENIFKKSRNKKMLELEEVEKFQTAILTFLCEQYHKFDWVQQFHLGAMRNNNSRMYNLLGADSGWDSIGQYPIANTLSKFLDALDQKNQLSKTILYNLNPADNEVMATMLGNFNDGSSKGKIQWGSAWWFLDQIEGMTNQINTLSNIGMISCFIGMLTDSRSFLSFPRHEYFRRLICNLFGNDIERGHLPRDYSMIGKIISDISYNNAKNYFAL